MNGLDSWLVKPCACHCELYAKWLHEQEVQRVVNVLRYWKRRVRK
jgi:hypothetical protein